MVSKKREQEQQQEEEEEALEELKKAAKDMEAAGMESKGVAEEGTPEVELRKYKVAVAVQEIDGVMHQVGDVLSLSKERAEQLKTAGYHLDEA